MRWRVRTGYPVAIIFLVLATPTPASILWGALIAAAGLIIRGAASGHLRKDRELATAGPYAFTRNPLYFGSAFLALGFAVAGHSWIGALLVLAYFSVFYYQVMRNEEADLHGLFGAAFDAYAARVPLFFPKIASARKNISLPGESSGAFSWAQYKRNREYKALIGSAGGLAILWLRMLLRAHFGY
jgi:protein-S-isoprenylcysteine O-methyltransferase Ste14